MKKNIIPTKIKVAAILIAVITMAVLGIREDLYRKKLLYNKLQSWCNPIDYETEIYRDGTIYTIGYPIEISGKRIELPEAVYFSDSLEWYKLDLGQRSGKWKIISEKPDSIKISDPEGFFSGRYAVYFDKIKGYPRDTLFFALSNDSTYILCLKYGAHPKLERLWME